LAEAMRGGAASAPRQTGAASTGDVEGRRKAALALWEAALPIQGSAAAHYLATRSLPVPDGTALRFLANARHASGAYALCLLALAVDGTGQGRAVHRTFLAAGGAGKAKLDPPRMTLGPVGGAVVRLCHWQEGEPLVIGEGIETSLSAGVLEGLPAWAALSAGNMAAVPLPAGLRSLVIAADNDAPGQRAADAAARAFAAQGLTVRMLTPATPGHDFNDLLQRRAARESAHG
jgi:putative DNA primase/helicase